LFSRGETRSASLAFSERSLTQKFLNKIGRTVFFMIEGRRLVAGDAILSRFATVKSGRVNAEGSVLEALVEKLVREHSRLVYRIAYAVLRRHHDAEDATQETFVRVLRYSAKLADVEDPKTWLARIAWRVAVDRSQRRTWTREVPLEEPGNPVVEVASSESPADETVHGAQVGAMLEQLIAALPEKLRQPLVLSTIDEMSPKEVGATLGINEAAVRSRVFRARQILKERLSQLASRK
jgi:RNA polymerase sigma-70 factor, ECF subfamily